MSFPPRNPLDLTPAERAALDTPVIPNAALFQITDNRCWYCGHTATTLSKLLPQATKLRHNKVPACRTCISAKWYLTLHEWRNRLETLTHQPFQFWGELHNLPLPLAQHHKRRR